MLESTCSTRVWPQKAIVRSSSLRMICSALRHAGLAHRAQAVEQRAADAGAACAPSASALITSWPERMPPSMCTSMLVADRVDDRRQRLDARLRAVELAPAVVATTISASAPLSTASRASSDIHDALEDQLAAPALLDPLDVVPGQRAGRTAARSSADSELMSLTPFDVADDVAEAGAARAEHAQAPARLGRQVEHVGERRLGRRGQAVLQVLVALAEDLQVQRQHQRRAACGLGAVDQRAR